MTRVETGFIYTHRAGQHQGVESAQNGFRCTLIGPCHVCLSFWAWTSTRPRILGCRVQSCCPGRGRIDRVPCCQSLPWASGLLSGNSWMLEAPERGGGGSLQVWWVLDYWPKASPTVEEEAVFPSLPLLPLSLSLITIFPASWRERSGLHLDGMKHPPSPAILRTLLPSLSSYVTVPTSSPRDGACDPKLSAYSFMLT